MDNLTIEDQMATIADRMEIENDLIHFLFLIGIHESGQGFKQYTKDEKLDLIELGSATLLSRHDYYKAIETQSSVPYYVANPDRPLPEAHETELLLKKEVVVYFNDKMPSL
jgi:seryl-tRNA(Sec) selenium transferase